MNRKNIGARILIVDDTPDHIAFAGAILKDEGYRVYAAPSGVLALHFLEEHTPDLIVLDIHMEDMDGLEVCRRIKENSDLCDIPVIFVTAETDTDIIARGFELGCCDYVSKPFVRVEYLARINAHLSVARQAKELTAAYDELNLFCSAVSHDLKSPLNVIRLLLGQLSEQINTTDEEIQNIIEMLDEKSALLVRMVERLLEFSRMCNIQPNMSMLNLQEMIEKVFEEQKLLESERNIILLCDVLPFVRGDTVLIQMMLKNILSNAFKFTQKRSKAILTVSTTEEGNYHVLSIHDNGAGFDMRYANKLFGVFQRLHDEKEFVGTGVGLAMVDRIMKRHGGKVYMEGEVDNGATIHLYFRKD